MHSVGEHVWNFLQAEHTLLHNNPYIHGKQQRSLLGPLQCNRQPGTERCRHCRQRRQFSSFARRVLHQSLRNPAHQFGQHGLQARSGRFQRHQLSHHSETVTVRGMQQPPGPIGSKAVVRSISCFIPLSVSSVPVFEDDFRLRLLPDSAISGLFDLGKTD